MDFPAAQVPGRDLGVLSTLMLAGHGDFTAQVAPGSSAWTSANRAIYIPFRVVRPILARKMFFLNGSTVSGNIDVGIYDAKGTRIISSGSTAQAGTSQLQIFDITDTWLGVGLFYFAAAIDNITATYGRRPVTTAFFQMAGVLLQASAFPLPATATFAAMATTAAPVIGLTRKTVI